MKATQARRELKSQYKERKKTGGVFVIRNMATGRALLLAAADLQGSKNRFEFAQKTGSCIDLKLQKDWAEQGGGAFAFEVLEELEKGETQTDAEFREDIAVLKEIWQEKLAGENAGVSGFIAGLY